MEDSTDMPPDGVPLEGVPLSLFVVMCSLALVGVVYTIGILIFNLYHRKDKIIKMTSPNLNVVILFGALCGYGAIALVGIDSGMVGLQTAAKLLQAGVFVLVISFSLMYGSLFSKSWRVFSIFRNLHFNGKTMRDEHLLLCVLLLVLVDLAIMLPWTLVDPITCSRVLVVTNATNQHYVDECGSRLQGLWVGLVYVIKAFLLCLGTYFTWQTRHVTLPSLKDANQIYVVIYTVVIMALVVLPVTLCDLAGMKVRYAVAAVTIFIVVTSTVTLAFVPKILLVQRQNTQGEPDMKFQFTESLRKTQEHLRQWSLCCCLGESSVDQYAQEVLGNEIDTLKRTIKEKDGIIRELNDRLYYGAEKFQEYLTTPKPHNALYELQKKFARRTVSHPLPSQHPAYDKSRDYARGRHQDANFDISMGDSTSGLYTGGADGSIYDYGDDYSDASESPDSVHRRMDLRMDSSYSNTPSRQPSQILAASPPKQQQTNYIEAPFTIEHNYSKMATRNTPSPNHDSAIENISPSSESSNNSYGKHQRSNTAHENIKQNLLHFHATRTQSCKPFRQPASTSTTPTGSLRYHHHRNDRTPQIDVEAIEHEASHPARGYEGYNGFSAHPGDHFLFESHYVYEQDDPRMAVSQI